MPPKRIFYPIPVLVLNDIENSAKYLSSLMFMAFEMGGRRPWTCSSVFIFPPLGAKVPLAGVFFFLFLVLYFVSSSNHVVRRINSVGTSYRVEFGNSSRSALLKHTVFTSLCFFGLV